MPVPDRPYQSRVLTFLNQQAILWGDRLHRGARHLQVWLLWSVQILAYPVYLLAQSARRVSRQLGQALETEASETAAARTHLPSDAALQNTLAAIAGPEPIRGLACTLAPRELAGVDATQALVPLRLDQQQIVQKRICYELASYYRAQQAQQAHAHRHQIPVALTDGERILPPLRWFWRGMRWVQRSPVAIAIDIFDESHLVPTWEPELPRLGPAPLPLLPPLPLASTLARLDILLAQWERRPQQWGERLQALPLARYLTPPAPATPPALPRPLEPPPKSPWLAWEELYGFAEPPLPAVLIAPVRDRQHPLVQPAESVTDPWLAWEDTYDNAAGLQIDVESSAARRQLALAPTPILLPQAPRTQPLPQPALLTMPEPPEPPHSQLPTPHSPRPSPHAPPPTIEVKAQPSGYVQHPLERILSWLDAVLYWLEEVAIALWRWLKRHRPLR